MTQGTQAIEQQWRTVKDAMAIEPAHFERAMDTWSSGGAKAMTLPGRESVDIPLSRRQEVWLHWDFTGACYVYQKGNNELMGFEQKDSKTIGAYCKKLLKKISKGGK